MNGKWMVRWSWLELLQCYKNIPYAIQFDSIYSKLKEETQIVIGLQLRQLRTSTFIAVFVKIGSDIEFCIVTFDNINLIDSCQQDFKYLKTCNRNIQW